MKRLTRAAAYKQAFKAAQAAYEVVLRPDETLEGLEVRTLVARSGKRDRTILQVRRSNRGPV